MAYMNPMYTVLPVPCLAGALTASTNGKSIDCLGARSLVFVYQFGTTTTGTSGTVTLKLQESSDDGSGDAFADISGATTTALSTESGGQNAKRVAIAITLDGRERYIRAVLTVAGTVSTGATGPTNNAGVLIAGDFEVSRSSSNYDVYVGVI